MLIGNYCIVIIFFVKICIQRPSCDETPALGIQCKFSNCQFYAKRLCCTGSKLQIFPYGSPPLNILFQWHRTAVPIILIIYFKKNTFPIKTMLDWGSFRVSLIISFNV